MVGSFIYSSKLISFLIVPLANLMCMLLGVNVKRIETLTTYAGEAVEQQELSSIASGDANGCSHVARIW